MKEWWKHYAGAVAFLAVLVLGAVLYVVADDKVDEARTAAHRAHLFTSRGFQSIDDAFRLNCEQDRRFRVQYKKRGRAVVVLLQLTVNNERSIHSPKARSALRKLLPLKRQVHVIPIPSCEEQIDVLRAGIESGQPTGR